MLRYFLSERETDGGGGKAFCKLQYMLTFQQAQRERFLQTSGKPGRQGGRVIGDNEVSL